FRVLWFSLCLFRLRNFVSASVVNPPLEVAPIATKTRLAKHAGHMVTYFLSWPQLCSFFPGRRPGDRASLPKICDIPLPIPLPASAAWLPTASRALVRNGDAGEVPLFPAPVNVSRPLVTTWHAGARDGSHIYRRGRDGRGFA